MGKEKKSFVYQKMGTLEIDSCCLVLNQSLISMVFLIARFQFAPSLVLSKDPCINSVTNLLLIFQINRGIEVRYVGLRYFQNEIILAGV